MFITLLERKILGLRQIRLGPNKSRFQGLTQPLLDGIKLLLKYRIIPLNSNKNLFLLSPLITFLVIVRL
jgi:NADH-quinone oxidoreductase subunit H